MTKFMKRNCEECLHSEVCKLIEPLKVVEDAMEVYVDECIHFLSGVNWSPEDSTEECECEHCTCNEEQDTRAMVWADILESILGSSEKKPEYKKMAFAPVEVEDIRAELLRAIIKVRKAGGEPVSITVTTPQLRELIPSEIEINQGDEFGMRILDKDITIKVNENITSAYISYKENK